MHRSHSVMLPRRGQFRQLYRALDRKNLIGRTPIIFCEGDSWFSTPLAMNLLDWLVSPAPQDGEQGVPLFGKGGLFFRSERSGDHASAQFAKPGRAMFTDRALGDVVGWFRGFEFDVVLLSAGGNDFADRYLEETFRGKSNLSPQDAFEVVMESKRFDQIRDAYALCISKFRAIKAVPILAHTYSYPRLIGKEAHLTVGNLGAAALLKKSTGPWIDPHIKYVIKQRDSGGVELREFARMLVDGFEEHVLRKLRDSNNGAFDYVDLRALLPADGDWFDEMHPTESGFHRLASAVRPAVIQALPPSKQ